MDSVGDAVPRKLTLLGALLPWMADSRGQRGQKGGQGEQSECQEAWKPRQSCLFVLEPPARLAVPVEARPSGGSAAGPAEAVEKVGVPERSRDQMASVLDPPSQRARWVPLPGGLLESVRSPLAGPAVTHRR